MHVILSSRNNYIVLKSIARYCEPVQVYWNSSLRAEKEPPTVISGINEDLKKKALLDKAFSQYVLSTTRRQKYRTSSAGFGIGYRLTQTV